MQETSKQKAQYPVVRGLVRGLSVLNALNRCAMGGATPAQLSELTGLHRTTVRRLLETLMAEGYVARSPLNERDTYVLSRKVRYLSSGFVEDDWVATIGSKTLVELVQTLAWPSDLTTPDGCGMRIRESTHRLSTLSFHTTVVGRLLPMLTAAAGRVYFGLCSEEQRHGILCMLRSGLGGEQQQCLAHDAGYIRNLVARVEEQGYALNQGDMDNARKTGAIAVPVFDGGAVIAAINVVYLQQAVSAKDAVARFLPPLQAAAQGIERALANAAGQSFMATDLSSV